MTKLNPNYKPTGGKKPDGPYAPRFDTSNLSWLLAGLAFALGLFAYMAASGGASEAQAFGDIAMLFAAACVTVGWVNSIMRRIELRLIDIQKSIDTKTE